LPIRFDNYKGCTHGCRYCFTQRKNGNLGKVRPEEGIRALENFINGKRTYDTAWCDWDIPIHWGGLSDPLQPKEKEIKSSLKCLEAFKTSQYPFVISTKGKLLGEERYIKLLEKCSCVVQVSMVCDKYDKLEPGAPTFRERLDIVKKISPRVKRVIVRVQPYMCEVFKDVFENLKLWSEAGAYGVILEGMKFVKSKPGLIKAGNDTVYPLERLKKDFERLKIEAHKVGLKFYSGENRLRKMGDSLTCCGIDGLEGFVPNTYNLNHIINDKNKVYPTKAQKEVGNADCFKTIRQASEFDKFVKTKSFEYFINWYKNRTPKFMNDIFGV
jgi:DNA repair photolyase